MVYPMNKVYLKIGAEDIQGNKLNTRVEYVLMYVGLSHSIINNGYRDIHVNSSLDQNNLGFFCLL